MTALKPRGWLLFVVVLLSTCVPSLSRASVVGTYEVTLDTSVLIGAPDVLQVFFQLTDGSMTGDGNSKATVTKFELTGGGSLGPSTPTGDASGDPTSSLVLGDGTSGENSFVQDFGAGSTLKFVLQLEVIGNVPPSEDPSADPPGTPDLFSFGIYSLNSDLTFNDDLITKADDGSSFLQIALVSVNSPDPTVSTFPTDSSSQYTMDAPIVTRYTPNTAVPEPSGLVMACCGAVALALGARRSGRSKPQVAAYRPR